MPRFHVAPADYPADEFLEAASDIEATTPERAAELYVELYYCDLEYPNDIDIRVQPFGGTSTVHAVIVTTVPEASAKLISPAKT